MIIPEKTRKQNGKEQEEKQHGDASCLLQRFFCYINEWCLLWSTKQQVYTKLLDCLKYRDPFSNLQYV